MFNLLKKEAECSFCIHTVKKPKTLPCLHSFCLDCLNKFAASRRQQGQTTFDCPVCLATFQLPNEDKFDAFPKSFYQNRLLDILALENGDTERQSCTNCEESVPATSFCFECKTFLCSACLDKHNGLKVTRAHRRASLQNLQTADVEDLIQRPVLCEKQYHENEPLEYYCQDCQVCICHKCGFVAHNKHSLIDIQEVAEKHKTQIIQAVEDLKHKVSACKKEIVKDTKNFEAVQQRIKSTREEVTATVEELIRVLKEQEATIMNQLEDLHNTQQQAHLAQQNKFELSLAQMNSSIEYVEAILKRNIGPEILQAQTAITLRCEELLKEEKIEAKKAVNVNFVTNEELCQAVQQSALGRVVVSFTDPSCSVAEGKGLQEAKLRERARFKLTTKDAEGQLCYSKLDEVTVLIQTATGKAVHFNTFTNGKGAYHVTYEPQRHGQHDVCIRVNGQPLTGSPWSFHVPTHQYQAISSFGSCGDGKGQFRGPRGVAISSMGNIAVIDETKKTVKVFTSEGQYLREFGHEILDSPISVAYTSSDQIIVVDTEKSEAFLFTESGEFLRHFGSAHLMTPWGISVTNHGHSIVCDAGYKSVNVLSSDGEELLLSFSAPECSRSPLYAVYHKEKFFVSYTDSHCVKVFDVTGNYIYDIGSEGTGDGQFEEPRGLAIDKFGNVLVVDEKNHRLQIFTPEGEFVSKIGREGTKLGQFRLPEDVAVSKNGRVYVTDYLNSRVQILH